jgi:hypothetical protein
LGFLGDAMLFRRRRIHLAPGRQDDIQPGFGMMENPADIGRLPDDMGQAGSPKAIEAAKIGGLTGEIAGTGIGSRHDGVLSEVAGRKGRDCEGKQNGREDCNGRIALRGMLQSVQDGGGIGIEGFHDVAPIS